MQSDHRRLSVALGIALVLAAANPAVAQTSTVDVTSRKQYIRGFGGMVHIPWAGDLTAAERTLVFGNADGQLGFTVLRIAVPDGSTSTSSYVATAKAAIAAGGLVYATPWNSSGNMNSSDFASYAEHLSSFVTYMKGQGAELYAISVQNEPDYGAQSGWRAWTPAQCHDFVLNYGDKVGTKLMSCESFNYTKSFYDPILNDAAALDKVGVLGTHLYGTSVNGFPYALFDQKAAGKVERWMTEHYTDSTSDANAWPNALGVATELHNSMVEAQFNAYTWWYIKRSYGPINDGAVTKRGWCMAHWSKFVRPGFYRVDATKSPTAGVSVSAYRGDTDDVVVVIVNTNTSSKSLTVALNGSSIASFDRFTTSGSKSMANDGKVTAANGSLSLSLDAQSVTTLYGAGAVNPSGAGGAGGSGGATGAGGSLRADAGNAGSTGADGATRVDVGGDRPGTSGAGGSVASGGTGGAGSNPGSGGAAGAGSGGAIATGGTSAGAGGPGGGNGSAGKSGSGGAPGAGGASKTGSTEGAVDTSNGCNCEMGRRAGGARALALFLTLPVLAWCRRRRLARRT